MTALFMQCNESSQTSDMDMMKNEFYERTAESQICVNIARGCTVQMLRNWNFMQTMSLKMKHIWIIFDFNRSENETFASQNCDGSEMCSVNSSAGARSRVCVCVKSSFLYAFLCLMRAYLKVHIQGLVDLRRLYLFYPMPIRNLSAISIARNEMHFSGRIIGLSVRLSLHADHFSPYAMFSTQLSLFWLALLLLLLISWNWSRIRCRAECNCYSIHLSRCIQRQPNGCVAPRRERKGRSRRNGQMKSSE